ncbi:MAG: hypothetical protein GPJ51_02250 [Candidatus Heimdallarchaeota archaeon]|nr:hypothetical protein [Candidatus Heimdallarchaeota archaeon]
MTEFLKKAESWNEKFKLSTQMVRDIPPDTILTNGWNKRKLYIHLYGWDNEIIKYAEELRQSKPFHIILEESIDEYNQRFFEENEGLDFVAAEKQFLQKREQMLSVCEELLTKYPQNNKEFVGFFFLWEHDAHHLNQAGVDVSDLEGK